MSFKLRKGPITAEATVTIHHPADSDVTFKGKFRILKHADYQSLVQKKKDDFHLIQEIMVGWSGITDDDGNEVTFNTDTLKEMCEYSFVRTGILRAYTDLHVGFTAAKN